MKRWLLVLLATSSCGKPAPKPDVATSSAASVSAPPPSVSAAASAPLPPATPACRALRVQGEAKVGGLPLVSGGAVDGLEWIELGRGASLTVMQTSGGREVSLAGPALFRACRHGREQVLLARGKVVAAGSMGLRPGGEVWIATPLAGVHYSDASFSLSVDTRRVLLELLAGQVEVEPPTPTTRPIKSPLSGKAKLELPLGKPDVEQLLASCKAAAISAEESARNVGNHSAKEPLGERAAAHVRARKAARAACTVAAAATGLVADPAARAGLWAEAERWEGLWDTSPGRPRTPEK